MHHSSILRRLAVSAIAVAASAGVLVCSVSPASAASVGLNNRATCNPNNSTIQQTIEAYHGFGETVALHSYLYNETTRQVSEYWMHRDPYASSAASQNTVTWSNMARGTYQVWYQWAVFNVSTNTWVQGPWFRLTGGGLSTYGRQIATGTYVGTTTGWCGI